jgi:hypothetical protein
MKYWKRSSTVPVVKHHIFLRMPQNYLLLVCLFVSPLLPAEEAESLTWQETWRGVDEAVRLYEAGEFGNAGALFEKVRKESPEGELDPDAIRLAEGRAWLQSGNAEKAIEVLETIEGFDADRLRSETRILEGSAAYTLAQQALEQQDLESAKENAERAQERFRNALGVDPANEAAAHNLELTQNFIRTLPEPPPQENQEEQENQENQQDDQENQENQEQESQDQQDSEEQEQQNQDNQQETSEDPQSQEDQEQNQQDQEQQDSEEESSEDQDQPSPEDSDSSEMSDPSDMSTPSEEEQQEFSKNKPGNFWTPMMNRNGVRGVNFYNSGSGRSRWKKTGKIVDYPKENEREEIHLYLCYCASAGHHGLSGRAA